MSFNETDFQSLFTKYVKKNLPITMLYELKVTKTNRLAFTRLEEHQETALLKAKHGCVHHKMSDQSRGMKPSDGFQICNSNAFVGVMFYKPRQPKIGYLIDIDVWIKERETSPWRSITEKAAQRLSQITIYF